MFMSDFPTFSQVVQAMSTTFLSGPLCGRTLPLTPTRLSDLDGGVFGPVASVVSTGVNVLRPVVKAGLAYMAGEIWDDPFEYYLVCVPP